MIVGDLVIDVGPGLKKLFPCLSRSYESVITCHEISSSTNHVGLGRLSLHAALLHFVEDHCLTSTCHAMLLLSCRVNHSLKFIRLLRVVFSSQQGY